MALEPAIDFRDRRGGHCGGLVLDEVTVNLALDINGRPPQRSGGARRRAGSEARPELGWTVERV
jgi:hypothetical protein